MKVPTGHVRRSRQVVWPVEQLPDAKTVAAGRDFESLVDRRDGLTAFPMEASEEGKQLRAEGSRFVEEGLGGLRAGRNHNFWAVKRELGL